MERESAPLSASLVLVVVLLLALVLVPLLAMSMHMGGMSGMMGSDSGAFGLPVGMILAVVGIVLIAVVLLAGALRGSRPVAYVGPPAPQAATPPPPAAAAPPPSDAPEGEFEQWALRILEGDERRLFREIVDKGGVAFQKDLGVVAQFSRAKVTRVLEKLERKGLVVKERAGMTNRVRLVRRQSGS